MKFSIGSAGVDVSMTFAPDYTTTRNAPLYEEVVNYRDTTLAMLVHLPVARSLAVIGGASNRFSDAAGVQIVRGIVQGPNGRLPLSRQTSVIGFTIGAEYSLMGGRLSVPMRATYSPVNEAPEVAVRGGWQFDVGIGATVYRRVRVF
jgi:hypothetical protein